MIEGSPFNIESIDYKWLINGGSHWGGGKPYKELTSFYLDEVYDESAVRKVLNRLECIIEKMRPDWTQLCERDIALLYQKIQDYKQAIQWFERWIPGAKKIDIYNYSYAFEDLANCYKEMGNIDQALLYMLKAHAIYANYYDRIASLYYEKGDITNAIIWYKKFYKKAGFDKPDGDVRDGNKVDFIKEMKKKGIYEKVIN